MPSSTLFPRKFLIVFLVTISILPMIILKDQAGLINFYNVYSTNNYEQNQHANVDIKQQQHHQQRNESENSSFVDTANLESSVDNSSNNDYNNETEDEEGEENVNNVEEKGDDSAEMEEEDIENDNDNDEKRDVENENSKEIGDDTDDGSNQDDHYLEEEDDGDGDDNQDGNDDEQNDGVNQDDNDENNVEEKQVDSENDDNDVDKDVDKDVENDVENDVEEEIDHENLIDEPNLQDESNNDENIENDNDDDDEVVEEENVISNKEDEIDDEEEEEEETMEDNDDTDEEEPKEDEGENIENVNDGEEEEENIISNEEEDEDEEETNEEEDDNNNNEQPKPHPFAGARDINGKWGYVADVTAVRRRHIELYSNVEYPIPSNHEAYNNVCEVEVGQGIEKAGGFEVMQKVQIGAEEEKSKNPKPKLLCAIYTYHGNHNRVEAVVDSWGWKCDGFLAASTLTNETIGAVDLPHAGEEMYDNMWQKTRSIWGYIYDNYMDDYDFFWLGGDDYYMIVENMVNYLATLDQSQALYEGHRIPQRNIVYCGGGPGYVLNKVALKRFGEEALPECYSGTTISAEDRFMSLCMKEYLGLDCSGALDSKGQQRFGGADAQFIARFDGKRGYFKRVYEFWGKESGEFKTGIDVMSEHNTGFHWLRSPSIILRNHALLHPEGACPRESALVQSYLEFYAQDDDDENEEVNDEEEEEE